MSRPCSLKVVHVLTLATIWEGLRFTGYHRADSSSRWSHHSRLRGYSSTLARRWMSPTIEVGHHYTRQHTVGIVTLQNCYSILAQVLMFEMIRKKHRCTWPVPMGDLMLHASL